MADRSLTRELIKTYGVDRDLPCPHCRYNLRGLSDGRCPECGVNVSAFIREAALKRGGRKTVFLEDVRDRVLAYTGPFGATMLAGGFWAAVRVSDPPVWIDRVVSGAMVVMVIAASNVWWRLARRVWRRKPMATRLLLTIACWLPGVACVAGLVWLMTL